MHRNERSFPLPFADFLDHLRRQWGFEIGVDTHLRVYEVLGKLGPACGPGDLKTLLGPVVATDRHRQEQFYTAFDDYFGAVLDPSITINADAILKSEGPRRERRLPNWFVPITLGGLAVLLGLLVWFVAFKKQGPETPPSQSSGASPTALRQELILQTLSTEPKWVTIYAQWKHTVWISLLLMPLALLG